MVVTISALPAAAAAKAASAVRPCPIMWWKVPHLFSSPAQLSMTEFGQTMRIGHRLGT